MLFQVTNFYTIIQKYRKILYIILKSLKTLVYLFFNMHMFIWKNSNNSILFLT
jgi:hypothetical protein